MTLPADPLAGISLADYGRALRAGETTAESATEAYLARIEALDSRLGAYQQVLGESAMEAARACDRLLAAGYDLGPLMGVPLGLKDLFALEGSETTAGSAMDVADVIGPEGPFVKALKRAGCVFLGKTKTVEFAFGATGTNSVRGTPVNPHDLETHRIPGGSSSGSAVSVATGMAAFAIGSDTGGSVRIPAALCGIAGLKTTVGLYPTEGCFPLSTTLDSIGPLCRSVEDLALVQDALTGQPAPAPAALEGLRFGLPKPYAFENMDKAVGEAMEASLARLEEAGAEVIDVEVPEMGDRRKMIPILLACEVLASLGRDRFQAGRAEMDPMIAKRIAFALDVSAETYIKTLRRQAMLAKRAEAYLDDLDGWITPTVPFVPPALASLADPDTGLEAVTEVTQNTQPGNIMGLCGISLPIHQLTGSTLPIGLQVLCRAKAERHALAIGLALENLFGRAEGPRLD